MSTKIQKEENPESTLNNKVIYKSNSEVMPSVLPDICFDEDNVIEFKECDGKQTISVSLNRLKGVFAIKAVGSPKKIVMFSAEGNLLSSGILVDDSAGAGREIIIATSSNSNKLENMSLSEVRDNVLVAIRDGASNGYDTLKDIELILTNILTNITDIRTVQLPLKTSNNADETITSNWTFTNTVNATTTNSSKLENKSLLEVINDCLTAIRDGASNGYDTLKDIETSITGILTSISDITTTQLPARPIKENPEIITGDWAFTKVITGTSSNSNKLENKSYAEAKDDIVIAANTPYAPPASITNGTTKILKAVRTVTGDALATPSDIYLVFSAKNVATNTSVIGVEVYNCSVDTEVYLNGVSVTLSDITAKEGAFNTKLCTVSMNEDMVLHIKLGHHLDGTTKHPAYAYLLTDTTVTDIGHRLFRIGNIIGTGSIERY